MEVAARDQTRFPDGVWLCELAALADESPVGHVVANALRIQQRPGLSIEQTVIEYLHTRTLLLVVDNCEHVLAHAGRLIADVVQQCPQIVVLATSREPLGVEGNSCGRSGLCRSRTPRTCSSNGPARRRPRSGSSRPPRTRWPRSAPGSTACRWASNSPLRGCVS
ncbi:hypothetical protein [Blastococcus brunescens]|uniref:NB-ARC domain-containing protein n=1 Tax=Blastococcus brunescens TaxID=1564165 RepID=A0ABZ1BBA0_9ACTN|nr:hypothetical protein [Blastococcus sp. BMG 8361]WRL67353.1 hypothetical protein U6N30_07090 [Blastococcus sp. BMG 8361]